MLHLGKHLQRLLAGAFIALAVLVLSFWQSLPYVPTQTRSFFGGGDISYLFWLFAWELKKLAAFDMHGLVNAEVFSPVPWAAAFSSQILATSLSALPLYALKQNVYWLYNVFVFLTYPVCFLGAYLYSRLGKFRRVSCLIAASLFAFSAHRLNMGGCISHISMQWIPFVFYAMTQYFTTGKTRYAYLFALFYLLNAASSEHYFVIGNLFIVLYAGVFLLQQWRGQAGRPALVQVAVPLLLILLGTTALYYPNLSVSREHGVQRTLGDVLLYAADLENYLGSQDTWFFPKGMERFIGVGNVLWPTLTGLILFSYASFLLLRLRTPRLIPFRLYAAVSLSLLFLLLVAYTVKVWPDNDIYHALYFIGKQCLNPVHFGVCLAAGAAILIGMVRGFWALLSLPQRYLFPGTAMYFSLLAVLVSLGPLIKVHGLFLALNPIAYVFYCLVPGGDALRAPTHAFAFFSLFFGVVCAFAFDVLETSFTRSRMKPHHALLLLLVLELLPNRALDFSLRQEPVSLPPEYAWLKSQPVAGPVLETPLAEDSHYMERALVHGKPLINGYASYFWRGYATLKQSITRQGIAGSVEEIRALGARYLIVHAPSGQDAQVPTRFGPFRLAARFPGAACYVDDDAAVRRLPPDFAGSVRTHLYGLEDGLFSVVLRFERLPYPCVTSESMKLRLTLRFDDGSAVDTILTLPPGLWGPTSSWDTASDAHLRLVRPNGLYPRQIELDGQLIYERGNEEAPPREAAFSTMVRDLARVNEALLAYYSKYKTLPIGDYVDAVDAAGRYNPEWIRGLVPEFLPELPRDPRELNDRFKQYLYFSDGSAFKLIASAAPDGYKVRIQNPQTSDPVRADAYGFYLPAAADW